MPSSRNANVTKRECAACHAPIPAGRARQWCSDACRQGAYRARHTPAVAAPTIPAKTPRRPHTVYQCPNCETRLLGTQRCQDCGAFMTRIGFGGSCPCCDEPVGFDELRANENPVATQTVTHPNYAHTTT